MAALRSVYDCVKAFSGNRFYRRFKKRKHSSVGALHGEDDQPALCATAVKASNCCCKTVRLFYISRFSTVC